MSPQYSYNLELSLTSATKFVSGVKTSEVLIDIFYPQVGAQWLSGRVLDSRPKGRGFEPHRRHCVVVLEQDTFILA